MKNEIDLERKHCMISRLRMKVILFAGVFFTIIVTTLAGYAINISDSPMETKVQSAPPNIMFVLDDSGSMDWEFMTPENEGTFSSCEYLFDDPGDNTYETSSSNGTILTGDNRKKWKSQWYGYNKIYYNPHVKYKPWPGKPDADKTAPLSNPYLSTTFNLGNNYMSFTTVSGSQIIVDNKTNTGNPLAAEGNFFTSGVWAESSHTPEYNGSSLYCEEDGTNEAFWTPNLPMSGEYQVFVFWARNPGSNRDPNAVYTVKHASGTTAYTVNQMGSGAGDWYYLGDHYFNVQDASWSEIIIDNFVTSGSWAESGQTPEWGGSSKYATSKKNPKATWRPELSADGSYTVYAWWNCSSNRDTNAKFTISHAGGTSTVYRNQNSVSGSCGSWVELGTYNFSAGTSGYVSVSRHSGSTGDSTVADAIKLVRNSSSGVPQHVKLTRGSTNDSYVTSADAVMFIPPGSSYGTIDIKNAHYFVLEDTDNDGEHDSGENVYLVNLTSAGRTYYLVDVIDGQMTEEVTAVTDPPHAIRPAVLDEQGAFVEYVSADDDLQNFANWYSYYRRRELTSKAAVANIINNLEGVKVGYYTINSSAGRQTVLPIKLDTGASVFVDNKESGFTTSGSWNESSAGHEFKDSSFYATGVGAWGKWTPHIKTAGSYKVYAWWGCNSSGDRNAEYSIVYNGGTDTLYQNQRQESGNVCGEWVELGTYTFAAGTGGSVSVKRHSSSDGTSTNADAVYFENLDGASVVVDETDVLLTKLYSIESENSTPLRTALSNVGKYFKNELTTFGSSPYMAESEGGACQQSFAIVMTDGFYNDYVTSIGNVDDGMDAPYGDDYSNTLADIAMKYYDTDLSGTLSNLVPTSSCDENEAQHMVTYTVSFGVHGTLTPTDSNLDGKEDDPCFLNDATPLPVWPDPGPSTADMEKIDDMWHAAINGRGRFFSASDPQELIDSLEILFEDIASRTASGASVSVNGEELGSDTTLYQAVYSSDTWTGDLYAYPMDPESGAILRTESDIKWKASGKSGDPNGLQVLNWDTDRKIMTYNTVFNANGSVVPFRYAYLSDAQKTALDSAWATDSATAEDLVDYLRGNEISGFRPRTKKLGDIVHSAPFLKGNAVYAGANDGMLHAFDKNTGREIFAYIPNLVFSNLVYLSNLNYTHRFYVDNTPSSQQGQIGATIKDILVCGLGKGGKGYFALDITDVATFTKDTDESTIASEIGLWEFPDAGTDVSDVNDMGFSYSLAHVVKSYALIDGVPRWVVIFGNGYNSASGYAKLFILDALDGTVIRKIDTGAGAGNGLSTPAIIDMNNDFIVDYVYAGDLKGNMWKFDMTDPNPANWDVAYKEVTTPKPLFTATAQPITARPDVMWHPKEHGFLVIFGTGQYFDNSDRSDLSQQTIYGIWDYGDDSDDGEYLGTLNHSTGALTFPDGISLVKQTVAYTTTLNSDFYRILSNNQVQWHEKVGGVEQELSEDEDFGEKPNPVIHAGWFFDFPNEDPYIGERMIKDVNIRGDKVFILSFIPDASPCSGGGNSFLYIIDPATGGRIETPVIDIDGDGDVDYNDLIQIGTDDDGAPIYSSPTGKLNVGMLHAPKFVKIHEGLDKVIMSDSSGDLPVEDIVGESLGMYYWLER